MGCEYIERLANKLVPSKINLCTYIAHRLSTLHQPVVFSGAAQAVLDVRD